jgi:hypothetical protein
MKKTRVKMQEIKDSEEREELKKEAKKHKIQEWDVETGKEKK